MTNPRQHPRICYPTILVTSPLDAPPRTWRPTDARRCRSTFRELHKSHSPLYVFETFNPEVMQVPTGEKVRFQVRTERDPDFGVLQVPVLLEYLPANSNDRLVYPHLMRQSVQDFLDGVDDGSDGGGGEVFRV